MLKKKLFRMIKQYLAQFISMIIMIAIGFGMFIGFNVEWYSLEKNTNKFFDETNFADYRVVNESGFSKSDLEKVLSLEGVSKASRYLSINVQVKGEKNKLALTVSENMDVSGFKLLEGDPYDETSIDGIWLSDIYASKNNIKIGDILSLEYSGISIKGTIKGLIKASEYLVCLPDSTQLMPDFKTYGYIYVSPSFIKNIIHMDYYTQINIISDLSKKEMSEKIDNALNKTTIVLSKDETLSYAQAQGEIEEGKTMGSILPVLFLGIAILIMVTTMHRLTINERHQMGILKALGFKDKKIAIHYASFSIIIGLIGSILGVFLGFLIGYYIMNPNGAMGTYIDMPYWHLYVPTLIWIILILTNILLWFIGYFLVKKVINKNTVEVLRGNTLQKVKPILLEKTPLWDKLSFGTKWNIRDITRHLIRSAMSLLGVLGCTILIIGSLGMKDTMNEFVDVFYNKSIAYENKINLSETITKKEALSLAKQYNADLLAESSIKISDKTFTLQVFDISHDLVKFVNQKGEFLKIEDTGVYICERISKDFGYKVGDSIEFSVYGSNNVYKAKISGILKSLQESLIMTTQQAKEIDFDYKYTSILTKEEKIEQNQFIKDVKSKQMILDSFDVFMKLMNVMVVLLIVAAIILGTVVLYNLGVMSFMERFLEMATLKVVGFNDKKIKKLLITQNLWITFLGVIIGIPFGILTLNYLLVNLASEYEMILKINLSTYILTIILTLLLSYVVSLLLSKKASKINMVASLKGID